MRALVTGATGFVGGHLAEALRRRGDEVTVLAETAIRGHDLDEAKAKEARKHAEEALMNRDAKIDYAKAQAELAAAIAQLQAIQRVRKKR